MSDPPIYGGHKFCNQLFRTVNHAELPRAVRNVLCHYMGNGDQAANVIEDEHEQVSWKAELLHND